MHSAQVARWASTRAAAAGSSVPRAYPARSCRRASWAWTGRGSPRSLIGSGLPATAGVALRGCLRSEIGAQRLAQPLQGRAGPGLDRPERLAERPRDLGLGQPAVVGQLDDPALGG